MPLFPGEGLVHAWRELEGGVMDRMDGVERGFLSLVILSFLLLVASVIALSVGW